MKTYQVIGGQFNPIWYGESDSETEAERIAMEHIEHWVGGGRKAPTIYHKDSVHWFVNEDMTEYI